MNLRDLLFHYAEHATESQEFELNDDFNRRLDDGDIEGYELILRKPDGEEQPISPVSAALFVSDLPTYRQLVKDDIAIKRHEVLMLGDFPTNDGAYDKLLNLVRHRATVVPFVGAGFSVSAGCPAWSDYIISQAIRSGFDEADVKVRLRNGQHEQLMDEVITRLSINVFQRDFTTQFEGGRISPSLSPSLELMGLFDGCYITTNFDRVLEKCHAEKHPFEEKVVGRDSTGRFLKAIYRSDKYLLKLHGNIDEQRDRILTRAEYNLGYGNEVIDYTLPIPNALKRIFGSFTVLFVGCSLISDRYLTVLKEAHDSAPEFLPEHFAIMVAPNDADERIERDRYMADHGITPIWFPYGEWDKPAEILRLLKLER
ncbi:SIR2 family protein [Pseudomonas monsensis]|uniref:SIR2 family protein n=1 Tax=Pseudomonas monsensis TaxID=2745509 RepID=UPI0016442070|nr:SIR2 family protein [Pseudomonas monsensis]QXI00784.1 SIR2 family protein [Pseudomonas monsensis]